MNEPSEIMKLHKELIASTQFTFPVKGKVNVSSKHGVYIIYNSKDEVLHVGNTPSGKKGLNQRLYNHISCSGVFYREYLRPRGISMRGKYKYRVLEVSVPRKRALLEALTAGLLCPAHLGTGEKKEKA